MCKCQEGSIAFTSQHWNVMCQEVILLTISLLIYEAGISRMTVIPKTALSIVLLLYL